MKLRSFGQLTTFLMIAMNKLEKVALRYTERRGRPLVLAISGMSALPFTLVKPN